MPPEDDPYEFGGLDPAYYEKVGRISSSWAMLEYHINETIWMIANVYPALGNCITSQIFALSARLQALITLAQVRRFDEGLIKQLHKFSEEIRGTLEKRNRSMHDPMMRRVNDSSAARLELTAKAKPTYAITPISLEDLEKTLVEINEQIAKFNVIQNLLHAALQTLPQIPMSELVPILQRPRPQQTESTGKQ